MKIFLFLLLVIELIYAQERICFNIFMKNENMENIKTGFSLECKVEEIKNIDSIKDSVTMKAINSTIDIVNSLRNGDTNRLAELSYSQKEIDFFNGILPFHQKMYKDEKVDFFAQIKFEKKQIICYKTFMENNNQKIPMNLFSLLCEKDNHLVFMLPNEIETMIAEIACRSLANGINKNKNTPAKGEILHKLRLNQDNSSDNECYLLFTGIPVNGIDVSTYDNQQKHDIETVHEIITFFKTSLHDIKNISTKEYADLYYTKISAKTFTNSLLKMQKSGLENYLNRICNGGYIIHYIIDASPYYVVFYTQRGNKLEQSEKKTSKYNYIFCIKEKNKIKSTYFLNSNTFFDSLIKQNKINIDQLIDNDKIKR